MRILCLLIGKICSYLTHRVIIKETKMFWLEKKSYQDLCDLLAGNALPAAQMGNIEFIIVHQHDACGSSSGLDDGKLFSFLLLRQRQTPNGAWWYGNSTASQFGN